MAYRTTREADNDIAGVFEFGALEYGFQRAEDYVDGLRDTLDRIGARPYIVRERTEFRPAVRIYPYNAHVVIYRIENEDALIIRILSARQDWKRHI